MSDALERDPDLYNQPVDRQFMSLIAAPLRKVRSQLRRDIIVVIDALDECTDADSVGQILSALIAEASDLPVKVLLTSRPEPAILSRMENKQSEKVRSELRLHELERSIVQSDIKAYLSIELAALNLEPHVLAKLVERSGVLFVYASTVVRYVMHNDLAKSIQRLNIITSTSDLPSRGYRRIDELYNTILDGALNDSDLEPSERDEMTNVIRAVVCAQEPLTVRAIASLLEFARVESVWTALRPLLSVLQASRTTGLVTTLHGSFPDYLLDSRRSGDFHCDPRTIERLVPFNICDLESSCIPDSEVSGLNDRVSSAISGDVSYACRYWEAHLEGTDSSNELLDRLFRFLSTRVFLWMEIMNLKHSIDTCVIMLSKLDVWLARVQTSVEARELAHDTWRFVNAFASGPIRHMTPHIYISVLALWPEHRQLSRYRLERFPGLTKAAVSALDRRDAHPLATLNCPDRVQCVACSPDGARIISGCKDGTICVWNAHTGQRIGEPLVGHSTSVQRVAISPDSRRMISGSSDQTIRIWDIYAGEALGKPLEGHTDWVRSVSYSPDGAHIISGSDDTTIRIWDAGTGQIVGQPLEGHTGYVCSMVYSPDGAYIVSGSADRTIRVWDALSGKLRGLLFEGHTNEINSVACSPDGAYIVSGSDDYTVRIWNAKTGQMSTKPLEGHTARVWSVAYSPDGARIVSGSDDYTVCIWDAGTGQMLGQPLRGHTDSVRSVSFSTDGLRIISGSDRAICIWDAQIGQTLGQPPEGHTGAVYSVAYSPDGARIASGSYDNTVCIWDTYTGKMVDQPLKGHTGCVNSVAYSLDGTRISSGSVDRTIRIWDASSGQMVGQPLEGHTGASVAFSPDGSRIASGSSYNTLRIWDINTGQMVGQHLKGHTDAVRSVAFSPDGAQIVSGSKDETIRIWDANTGQMVGQPLTGHTGSVQSVSYSPSGTYIASGSDDGTIRIWDAYTGEMVGQPLEGHTYYVMSVAYSPDGAHIVSGSADMTIRIWDAHTGQMLGQPLEGHMHWVHSVAYSPDGKQVVSGSHDKSIRIWDVCALSNLGEKSPDNPNLTRQPSLSSDIPEPISSDSGSSSRFYEPRTKTGLPIHPNPSGMYSIPCVSSYYSLYEASITYLFCNTPDPDAWAMSKDGWVVSHDLEPLLWVPPELRDTLLRYGNTCMISSEGSWSLDLSRGKFGTEWQQCYRL
ncbi:hypothetical protein FRC09_014244 [Ceratobasidium sp. 395]|nr:hypothetical protein FRC09_014244 [Ceratobasidium sp. 395]